MLNICPSWSSCFCCFKPSPACVLFKSPSSTRSPLP
jgi:hypothetical protein